MKWKGNRNGTKEEVRRKVEIQRDRVLEGKEPAGRNAERHTRAHTQTGRQREAGRERQTKTIRGRDGKCSRSKRDSDRQRQGKEIQTCRDKIDRERMFLRFLSTLHAFIPGLQDSHRTPIPKIDYCRILTPMKQLR